MCSDDREHLFEAGVLLRRNAVVYKHAYKECLFRRQSTPKLLCINIEPSARCSDGMRGGSRGEKVRTIKLESVKHIDAHDEHAE